MLEAARKGSTVRIGRSPKSLRDADKWKSFALPSGDGYFILQTEDTGYRIELMNSILPWGPKQLFLNQEKTHRPEMVGAFV